VLVVGRPLVTIHWMENTVSGFRHAGCDACAFSTRGPKGLKRAAFKLAGAVGRTEAALRGALARTLAGFRPDLVFFVAPFHAPSGLIDVAREAPERPLLAGWVGDRFGPEAAQRAGRFDRLHYADTGFLAEAERLGFPPGRYLPLAAHPDFMHPREGARREGVVFVASATPGRVDLLKHLERRIDVYGDGWGPSRRALGRHAVRARRLHHRDLAALYSAHAAALNICNELNVVNGLNHRSFEPAACGTPVLHDALPDLERCFEPGKEVLVYGDVEELAALWDRVQADPAFARGVGEAARRRVLAEHTYAHRARAVLADLALGGRP